MSHYDQLTGLIDSGEIDLIHVEAVPRSISTALARALSESDTPSIYVNEPFNRMKHDIEDASMRILEAVNDYHTTGEALTVISKNMARNISPAIFSEIMDLSKGVVWSVRDPVVQVSSLLTRIANDLEFEPGADHLTQDDLTDEHIRQASDFLENGPKSTGFSKTSWYDIREHYRSVRTDVVSEAVDGGQLTVDPTNVLRGVAQRFGLVFSNRMATGWQGTFVNANTGYNPNLTDDTHAWTRDAVISTGITRSSEKRIEISRMPLTLQRHILQVALPTYEEMTGLRHSD